MSNLSTQDYAINKYTGRTLRKDGRTYKASLKKLKREEEDNALLEATALKRRKKKLLREHGINQDSDSDDESLNKPKLKRSKAAKKKKPTTKKAMEMLSSTLDNLDPDAENGTELLHEMFQKLLHEDTDSE